MHKVCEKYNRPTIQAELPTPLNDRFGKVAPKSYEAFLPFLAGSDWYTSEGEARLVGVSRPSLIHSIQANPPVRTRLILTSNGR